MGGSSLIKKDCYEFVCISYNIFFFWNSPKLEVFISCLLRLFLVNYPVYEFHYFAPLERVLWYYIKHRLFIDNRLLVGSLIHPITSWIITSFSGFNYTCIEWFRPYILALNFLLIYRQWSINRIDNRRNIADHNTFLNFLQIAFLYVYVSMYVHTYLHVSHIKAVCVDFTIINNYSKFTAIFHLIIATNRSQNK